MEKVKRYRFHFPLETRDDLEQYLDVAWGVRIPKKRVCPHHSTPWDALCDAYFAVAPVVVWEGSRGFAGKSFNMATLGVAEGTSLGADVNILGGSGEQSRRVLEGMQGMWGFERAPKSLLVGDATRITHLSNGATITSLMASQASVRGPHPPRLRVDEVDEVDLDILDASLGQAMDKKGAYGKLVYQNTLLSSTHQHADGTMTEVKKRAKHNGWPMHTWCYRETLEANGGWLTQRNLDAKKGTIPQFMWETEYELQEPSPTGRAIMPEAVRAMFRRDLGEFPMSDQEQRIEGPAGGRYSHGADWAKTIDRTVILTLRTDVKPMRFVACRAFNRRPWPVMVGAFDERVKQYGGKAAHDATGIGNVVEDYKSVEASPVVMVGRPRAELFTAYINAIEKGEVVAPWWELMELEHRYCLVEDLYGTGHPPDTFVAGAMAYHAATKVLTASFAVA